ncbi:hypothetical protein MLD38_040274 [Melastoma candidum]|uniref:Uncharacterized protein n=1 Tax=Melastoma candidum TaxID=119954 RepID=A0ACB9L5W2_9MYRT|nr:hypothetical protein MLD38_040274 [Melastoma candidum]
MIGGIASTTSTQLVFRSIRAHFIKGPKPHLLNPVLGSLFPQDSLLLYNLMLSHPSSHNHYTFTYALKACSSLVIPPQKGLEVHGRVIITGHYSDLFIQNSLLGFYFGRGEAALGMRVFGDVRRPDAVSWSCVVSGLARCGFETEAVGVFSRMDVRPNVGTLVSVVSAACAMRYVGTGKAVHGYAVRNRDECSINLENALLDFYVKCGCLEQAELLFVHMEERDVVSWTSMIGGYVVLGLCGRAIELFREMIERSEAEPNEATIVNVLMACSLSGMSNSGLWVYDYVNRNLCFLLDGAVGNALINMFVKCGHVAKAFEVFSRLPMKDLIAWSSMIGGFAMNGHGLPAVQLFSLMLVHGVSPDDVTFVSLLSACSHSGLVDQGNMFFHAMVSTYGVEPEVQHYTCMVDMYGRAGLLKEAESLIRELSLEAQGQILGALLNACKIHGGESLFEKIKQRLVEARDVSVGTFALLSNAYAGCQKWNESNKVRDDMRHEGLNKIPGSTALLHLENYKGHPKDNPMENYIVIDEDTEGKLGIQRQG